jgi:DNA polymerase-4
MSSPSARTIFHADMDAFFAAVEQRDDPALRGRPVIVGGRSARGVVAAASYEARVYGIHSAMPTVHARRLCPDAVFVAGDMRKYRRESRRIFAIFDRYSPAVEALSLDEAFLDMTGSARLLGDPVAVATRLRGEVRAETGLAVSVDEVRAFLAPLPVGRIFGVGPVARARLTTLGVATIGDLRAIPEARLAAALGAWGVELAGLARGEDARAVVADREAKSYGEEQTFARDVESRERLCEAIRAHAEAIARRLRRDHVRGRRVTLKLKLARALGGGRYPLVTRALTLPDATDDGAAIAAAARTLLTRVTPHDPIRLLGVAMSRLESAAGEQMGLLATDRDAARRARLNRAVDTIQARYGDAALRRGVAPAARAGLSQGIKRGED